MPVRAEDGGRAMTGTHITSIYDHRHHIRALEWSGFGLLASSGKDSRVLIHAFEDGVASLSIELSGHNGEVWGVSWAPDGSQLATAANDNSVRVWDITRDQAKQSRKYTMWHMRKKCRYLRWLNVEPQRLACARDSVSLESPNTMSEEPPFTYWMEYTLMDYRYQAEVLRGLTYGYLTQDDLRSLGCDSIALTVMDPALSNQAAAAEGETMAWNSTEWKPDGACRP